MGVDAKSMKADYSSSITFEWPQTQKGGATKAGPGLEYLKELCKVGQSQGL